MSKCTMPAKQELEQPEPNVRGHHGPTHPTAGQADIWAATTTANQAKCCQQHNNLTRRHAANGLTTTKHARRETNDVGDSLQRSQGAGQAHTGHCTTPQEPFTGGHDISEPRQRAGHTPVATQPPQRTGRPPQNSELTEKTTKTTSGYAARAAAQSTPRRTSRP